MDKKYVCIAIQSTAQLKYWNYKDGWKRIIRYLNSKGYKVYAIDKYAIFGGENNKNKIPDNAIDKTGMSVEKTIKVLKNAEFFIGISSGLAWLSWAIGIPVIMISGMTPPSFEFTENCYRVFNPNVCNSCFANLDIEFDKNDWMFCPYHKGTDRQFECSKSITPEMVIEEIDKIIE